MADPDNDDDNVTSAAAVAAAAAFDNPMEQDNGDDKENEANGAGYSQETHDSEHDKENEANDAGYSQETHDSEPGNDKEQGDGAKKDDDASSSSDDIDSSDDDDSSSEEDSDEEEPSSQNVASAPTVVTTEDGHTLSAYEVQRLERIRRNKEYLASLGLEKNKPRKPVPKKPKPARRKPPDIKRRSSISRASKEKKVTYSERKKDKEEDGGNKEAKEPWKRPKEDRSKRMERFIHDEFRRIGKEQRHHLKRAKKNVRAADVEYRIAKQRAERYDKKRAKQLEYQKSIELIEEERRALGGKTAKEMSQEVNSRWYEMAMAIRNFDERFNPDWAKQQEENSRKIEIIDAMDRFPKVLKEAVRDLDVLLLERSPRDPPPPRRGTRKRKTLDSADADEEDLEPDTKTMALESPNGARARVAAGNWGSLASAITAETLSSSARTQSEKPSPGALAEEESDSKPAAKQKPKKKKREVVPMNVGGWVSPAFSQEIDRSWLAADRTPTKFDPSSYIPQIGDTVLYYPAGHKEFLKLNPDVLGKKTRKISRMTLWDRAKKEKTKLENAVGAENAENGASQDSENKPSNKWWNDEWLSLIDGDLERYPIICRVEKTHAEFPPDPDAENKVVTKDDASGGVQVSWAIKKKSGQAAAKKKQASPSLRLAVMLRPLTSVMPPRQGEGSAAENLTLAPNFYVITFPSQAAPFLVPFSWAYRLAHSLTDGTSIRLSSKPEWRAKVRSFKSLDGDHGSSRFDDKMDSIRELCSALKSGPKSFGASLEEALSSDGRASIPLTDACTVIERFESALDSNGAATTALSKPAGGETPSMMRLVRSTLPLWKEVVVASGSGRAVTVSAWELMATDTKISVPTGPLVSISADIEAETGLVYSIDEPLRAKIECTLEDYLKDTPPAAMFCPPVTDEEAPSYSCAVPRGMAFNKILQRLRTGKKAGQTRCYYRSVDSLLGDIAAIADNCVLYNSPDSSVVENILEIVPSIKGLILQVASQHFKEKEAMEKLAEERRQAIEFQCNAPALLNDGGQQSESASRSRGNRRRPGLQPPYTEFLHRSWIQDTQPDGSWPGPQRQTPSNEEQPSTVKALEKGGWLPQSGDTILYSRSLHSEFIKGHHPSLTTEQCELPVFSGESDSAKQSESQDDTPSSGTPLSDELQNRWLVGKITWVRAAFPRAPSKRDSDYENTFEVASPVLDLGIRFNYSWASNKVYAVSWRPCTFAKEEVVDSKSTPAAATPGKKKSKRRGGGADSEDAAAEESTKPAACGRCDSCHLNSDTSFVHPAWIPLVPAANDEQKSSAPYLMPDGPFSVDNLFSCPTGLSKELIGSIDRCLNVLKRRCLDGVPANHVDPKFNTENVKNGWSPPAPKIGKSLPTFDRLLDKGNAGSSEAATRGVEKVDKRAVKLLADATFLPQWTKTLSEGSKKKTNRDGITQSLALQETLSPTPSFCLELIQTRLRNGYYRKTNSLAHDIQEAYVTTVLLLLAKPAMAKMGQAVSIRRIAKALSSTKDVVSFANSDSKKATKTTEKVVAAAKQGETEAAKSSVLSEKEQQLVDKIFQIRKLHATALACAMQPVCMEKIFGSVPKKKTTAAAKESIGEERQQTFMRARNTLGYIYQSLLRDPCDNRPSMSWNPSVKVKIRFTGQEEAHLKESQEDTSTVDTTKPIVIPATDFESNEALVKFFFGHPGRMGPCASCSAYGRSTMTCRVRKNHSRPDFDWVSVFRGTGGLDGLLYTLRTGREPPEETMADNAAMTESQPVASLPSGNAAADAVVAATAVNDDTKEPDPFALLEKAVGAVSLAAEVLEKAQKFASAPVRLSEQFVDASFPIDPSDDHYNYCILCGLIGDVICCEGCPNVVHPYCVNLSAIPDEDWFCSRCKRQGKGPRSSEGELKDNASADSQKVSAASTGAATSSGEEKKDDAIIPHSQDSSDTPGAGAKDGEKEDGDTNSGSHKASAAVAGATESQEPSAAASEEEKKGEESSKSQKPSEALAASVGADVLPALMAAPFGLDDEADRLEGILSELKAARPIRPKKPKKKESTKSKEQDGVESSGDEDEPPSSPAGKARPSRSTRSSAAKDGKGADGADSSDDDAEEEDYGARPQPMRIRVGMKVKKYFGKEHGYFYGKVLEVPSSDNPFYLVRYEDDDEEDMTEQELRKCILGSTARRPSGRRSSRRLESAREEEHDDDQEPAEPAKRRGRPSRPRSSVASDQAEAPATTKTAKRGRGRPSRTRATVATAESDDPGEDNNDHETAEPAKRRGRPSRARSSVASDQAETPASTPRTKRGRGRPSRTRASVVAEDSDLGEDNDDQELAEPAKRRGRFSRTRSFNTSDQAEETVTGPTAKRGRGRPSRTRASTAAEEEAEPEGEQIIHSHGTRSNKKRRNPPIEATGTRTSKRKRVSKAEETPPKKRGRGRPRKHT